MNALTWNQVAISGETAELVKACIAPSTVKAYRRAMQQLEIWLDGRALSDNLVANYITGLYRDGKSPATISKIVAAVKWMARNNGVNAETHGFEITERTLAGMRRKGKGRGRGQVDAITWDEVKRICGLAEAEETVAGLRDSALIRLMSDCLLRISEAVAVDVADVNSGLTVHRSKCSETQPTKTDIFCDAAIPIETPIYQQEHRRVIIKGKVEEVWAKFGISTFLISIRRGIK